MYFFASEANRTEFVLNAVEFLQQPTPPPFVPVRVAIVGPPKSGKSTLADWICRKYGCIRISIGSAVRTVLSDNATSALGKRIVEHLSVGDALPDELAMEAVAFVASSPQAQTFGYVLDGFPVSKLQAEVLSEQYIIPVSIIELEVPEAESMRRYTAAKASNAPVSLD